MTATAAKSVRLRVNEKRLPEILRNSFTSWENVLKELLQNARRAGASRIEMSYDAKTETLEVADGGGISNMQDLLHIAESGWNDTLKAEEKAFGVGFMAALYAGEEITVESGTERLSFNTTRALSFHDLPVETLSKPVTGARVRLHGFKVGTPARCFPVGKPDAAEELGVTLQDIVQGFPVPVRYNGKELKRPHAVNSGKPFAPVSVGQAHLLDIHNVEAGKRTNLERGGTEDTRVYLQGFLVAELGGNIYDNTETNIIHLDTSTFMARMPDRDVLVNADKQKERIKAAIKDYWRDTLTRELPGVDAPTIADKLYQTLQRWGMLSALNDVPYLPCEAWEYATERPLNTSGGWGYSRNRGEWRIAREDVEAGKCILMRNLFDEEDIGYAYKTLAYKHNRKFVSLKTGALDSGHWAFKYAKPVLEDGIEVIVNNPKNPHYYNGSWVSADVILCKDMLFKTPYGEFTVNDCAIYTGSEADTEECEATFRLGKKGGKIKKVAFIIPENDPSPDEVVHQMSSFVVDNDYSSEDEADNEKRDFRNFLASISDTPPEEVLLSLLRRELDTGLVPTARGMSFILRINRKGEISVARHGGRK